MHTSTTIRPGEEEINGTREMMGEMKKEREDVGGTVFTSGGQEEVTHTDVLWCFWALSV